MDYIAHVCRLLLILTLVSMAACPKEKMESEPESHLPEAKVGPNGENISFSQLVDNTDVLCPGVETTIRCNFNVDFTVTGLKGSLTAQLLVEISRDTNGNKVFDNAVFLQASNVTVTPDQPSGQLAGTLGPPVTDKVRFNLAVTLRDQTGLLVASSNRVLNLRPI